ncbi:DUF45 domain-containing protein [Candidatus Saccharibacteria bacterium]|nr:DUF45 domain-containing protein [Candidatus Saccharibacteria bacterium]
MPAKFVEIEGIGVVALYKRKGVNGVRMSITHDGTIRISLPSWAPYRLGVEFARNKASWIVEQRKPTRFVQHGDRVGKAHRFIFELKASQARPTSRIHGTDIKVTFAPMFSAEDKDVQAVAEKAAIRALKKEARQLLPQRLATLAKQQGFTYNSVAVKRLKSRWGSCNERKDIVLNCFLMQLPWYLIDYVLLHELVHTKVLRHGEPFWNELSLHIKDLKAVRKEMKSFQPTLMTVESPILHEDEVVKRPVVIED